MSVSSSIRFVCRLRFAALLPAIVLAVVSARAQSAAPEAGGADALRAVYLVNFIRFTEWPAEALAADSPYVVGVAGNRGVEDELMRFAEKQRVRDRRLRVVRVNNVRDTAGCHVLYMETAARPGEENAPGVEELLPAVRHLPVLTVSDGAEFTARGGIVGLFVGEEGKLRFAIAPDNARAAGLTLSSRLLALARIVSAPVSPRMP